MSESHDLFETFDQLPSEVQQVFSGYDHEDPNIDDCRKMLAAVEKFGFTFDYDLGGNIFDLQRIESDSDNFCS